MKYLLIVFFQIAGQWPFAGQINHAQVGPFENLLACEKAASQAELIVREIGATKSGSFCTPTKRN